MTTTSFEGVNNTSDKTPMPIVSKTTNMKNYKLTNSGASIGTGTSPSGGMR